MKPPSEIQNAIDNVKSITSSPARSKDAKPATAGRYKFTWAKDLKPSLRTLSLVKNILGEGDMSVIYGDSGTTKTFLAVDISCHIAAGEPWRGHDVTKGTVVYIAAENPKSVHNRVIAWLKHHDIDDIHLVVMETPIDLCDPNADTDPLIEAIKKSVEGHPPVVLVVSTSPATSPPASTRSPTPKRRSKWRVTWLLVRSMPKL